MTSVARIRLVMACLLASSFPAHAVEPLDTVSLRVGGFVTKFDTTVRANGQTAQGTAIDLSRDFGLDDSATVGYVAATWRPWEHHEFGLAYYQDDADATRMLARDITVRDTTYRANSIASLDVALDAYEGYYTWWALSHETWALGPRLGLVWYELDLAVALQVDVDGTVVGGGRREEASADLPAATLGGSWRWVPAPDWRISADAGYFAATINDVDADIVWGRVGAEWFPWERAGFSLDYTISQVEGAVDQSRYSGDIDFINSGVRLGFVYRW